MKISQNSSHRFDVKGINDPGKKIGNKAKVKTGIAGYKSKFVGCMMKIFGKAVLVKTEGKNVYLNSNSFAEWVKRVQPNNSLSKEKLEKFSHYPKQVEKIIQKILQKQKVIQKPVQQVLPQVLVQNQFPIQWENIPIPEEVEDSIEEVPELSMVATKPSHPRIAIKEFFENFNDRNLLGSEFNKIQQIVMNFNEYINRYGVQPVMYKIIPLKDPNDTSEKQIKETNYYAWMSPHKNDKLPILQVRSQVVDSFKETPSKELKRKALMDAATQMAAFFLIFNASQNQEKIKQENSTPTLNFGDSRS